MRKKTHVILDTDGVVVASSSEKVNIKKFEQAGYTYAEINGPLRRNGGTVDGSGNYIEPAPPPPTENEAAIAALVALGSGCSDAQIAELIRRERFGA